MARLAIFLAVFWRGSPIYCFSIMNHINEAMSNKSLPNSSLQVLIHILEVLLFSALYLIL